MEKLGKPKACQPRTPCSVSECPATFSRKSDYYRHKIEVHGQAKRCPIQGCTYNDTKRQAWLKPHMKNAHPELYTVGELEILTSPLFMQRVDISSGGIAQSTQLKHAHNSEKLEFESSDTLQQKWTYAVAENAKQFRTASEEPITGAGDSKRGTIETLENYVDGKSKENVVPMDRWGKTVPLDEPNLEAASKWFSIGGHDYEVLDHTTKIPITLRESPYATRPEVTDLDEQNESRSVISASSSIDSIPDDVFSLVSGSSMSSVTGFPEAGERLLLLLLGDEGDETIRSLCVLGLGIMLPERLERNLRRLIISFAADLKTEAKNPQQRQVARFVRLRARNLAHRIMNTLDHNVKPIVLTKPPIGSDADHEDEDEDSDGNESDDELDDLGILEPFIKNSNAIVVLHKSLRAFVSPAKEELPATEPSSEEVAENQGVEDNKVLDVERMLGPGIVAADSYDGKGDVVIAADEVISETTTDMEMVSPERCGGFTLLELSNKEGPTPQEANISTRKPVCCEGDLLMTKKPRHTMREALKSSTLGIGIGLEMVLFGTTHLLMRSMPLEGKTRIKWKCRCGHEICDDFTELVPGGAERYRLELESRAQFYSPQNSDSSCMLRIETRFLSFVLRLCLMSNLALLSLLAIFALVIDGEKLDQRIEVLLAVLSFPGLAANSFTAWVILIMIQKRQISSRPELTTAWLVAILSGLDLLKLSSICWGIEGQNKESWPQMLNTISHTQLGFAFGLVLLSFDGVRTKATVSIVSFCRAPINWIKFVHFEMYKSELVDVRKDDEMPPKEMIDRDEYRYTPAPPEVVPPVGYEHMMHLFYNPQCADNDPLCLERFPKKLKERLLCKRGRKGGWGIQFVEKWDWIKISLVVFTIFGLGSLLFGVLWARYHGSIQDGFTIAQYMIGFSALAVGMLQTVFIG